VGAELWAITNGLKLAWSKGFRKIILESDSSLAVDLITKNKIFIDKNYNLIMQARELLAKEWDIQVRHVYREANSMADWLANYGLTRSFLDRFSIYFNDPPAGLYCILYYDLIGSTLPCLI
jgi:ribonuclease HI